MPLPSYKEIKRQRDELLQRVIDLSKDANYGITVREAIPHELRDLEANGQYPRYIIFLDIDDCHGANNKYGYDLVNKKIRRAIHVRHADILLRGRWFSGDELVVIVQGDPEGTIERLRSAFKHENMSATFGYSVFTGDLDADVRQCAAIVQAHKEGYER
jgi:hypothetical protein